MRLKKFISMTLFLCFIFTMIIFKPLFGEELSPLLNSKANNSNTVYVDVSKTGYNPIFAKEATKKPKPYTIMYYLNGADLESEYGIGTKDLNRIITSNVNYDNVNIIILANGTKKWKNNAIDANTAIYRLDSDGFHKLVDFGKISVEDTKLLTAFIDYSYKYYEASNYGFIFWNHGGGFVYGYGHDENFDDASISIAEIKLALNNSRAKNKPFEFIGFDCCLMSSVEIAYLLKDYSKYLIASQEIEPGYGWDGIWVKHLSDNPRYNGFDIGKIVVDTYITYHEKREQDVTLSVLDLGQIENLVQKIESFADKAKPFIDNGNYNKISKARFDTKTFGTNEFGGTVYDAIDILDFAKKLNYLIKPESDEVIGAVKKAVVYNRISKNVKEANGISIYMPFLDKKRADRNAQIYNEIKIMPKYYSFLEKYVDKLNLKSIYEEDIKKLKPTLKDKTISLNLNNDLQKEINQVTLAVWRKYEKEKNYFLLMSLDSKVSRVGDKGSVKIDHSISTIEDKIVCMYEMATDGSFSKYYIPALLNDRTVNIIVVVTNENPEGKIIGALPLEQSGKNKPSRYMIDIKPGDKLQFEYYAEYFDENISDPNDSSKNKWVQGDAFVLKNEIQIKKATANLQSYLYAFWIQDIYNEEYYTDSVREN